MSNDSMSHDTSQNIRRIDGHVLSRRRTRAARARHLHQAHESHRFGVGGAGAPSHRCGGDLRAVWCARGAAAPRIAVASRARPQAAPQRFECHDDPRQSRAARPGHAGAPDRRSARDRRGPHGGRTCADSGTLSRTYTPPGAAVRRAVRKRPAATRRAVSHARPQREGQRAGTHRGTRRSQSWRTIE